MSLERPKIPAEVVASGGEAGVGATAVAALEAVAVHTVLGLHVADHGFDRGPALADTVAAPLRPVNFPCRQEAAPGRTGAPN